MRNIKTNTLLVALLMLLLAKTGVAFSQNRGGVRVSFKKTDTDISYGDFASNVIRIVNNTGSAGKFSLMLSPPAGWQLIGNPMREIDVAANDSLFIPVRLKQRGEIRGDMTYVTNAFVMVRGFTVASAVWNISIIKKSDWHVKPSSNRVYFTSKSDSTSFYLNLTNNGNSDENLLIKCKPESGLFVENEKGEPETNVIKRVALKAGMDTFIVFKVLRDAEPSLPTDYENEREQMYRLNLRVENENKNTEGKGHWQGRVNFVKLESESKIKASSFISFPLTFEFNSYNILTDNTYATLSLYGYHDIGQNRAFSYYYQGSFIKNQFEWRTYLGNYFYVGYFSENYRAEIGDITSGRSGSRLIGKGVKASTKRDHHELGALYIANPSPFKDPVIRGGGVFYNYTDDKLLLETYYESSKNTIQDFNTNYVSVDASYSINHRHLVRLGGGFSSMVYNLLGEKFTGYKATAGYVGNVKKININLNARYHSPHYAPWRGNVNMNASLGYHLNPSTRLRGGAAYYKNQPAMVRINGTVVDSLYTGRNVFFLQLTHTKKKNVYFFKPEYTMYTSNLLDANTGGFNFEYRIRASHDMSFYSSAFAGGSAFPSHDVDPIFVANMRLSLRYKNFNTNIRYYFGPYYLNEQYYYVNTLQNPQRFFAMAFYDWWFARNHMDLKTNLNYNYATMYKRHQLVIRPELFYFTRSRFRFSIYTSYMLFANGEYERFSNQANYAPVKNHRDPVVPAGASSRIEGGFGIKFDINVPVGKRKNFNATMVVFRDANGNGIKDRDEQGYANMLIRVTKVDESFNDVEEFVQPTEVYELITDEDGKAEYLHIPKGNYKIESMPLLASEGWFGSRKMFKFIDGNQTIYIPLSKGAKLSGGIFVERDVYSDGKAVQIGGIRVTAINQLTGESYSTLTDQYGNYSMHLPNGEYVININEGAVGTRFSFSDNNIPLSVKSSGKNYNISFYLSEKKRQIRFGHGRSADAVLRNSPIVDNRNRNTTKQQTSPDNDFMPVSNGFGTDKGFVIKLFPDERALMLRSEFDKLQQTINVYCIKGDGGKYLYYTDTLNKKGSARKMLKTVKQLGFNEAVIEELKK